MYRLRCFATAPYSPFLVDSYISQPILSFQGMDELQRIQKCLQTLQGAPTEPVKPLTMAELLQKVRDFKAEVNDQLNRVKAFNHKARQLKESLRRDIPNILKLCHENPFHDLGLEDKGQPRTDLNLGTPPMETPQLRRKSVFINPGFGITTPRRNTPVSMSKLLLQSKFAACGSPSVKPKTQYKKTPGKRLSASPQCTPQMPTRRNWQKAAVTRVLSIPARAINVEKPTDTVQLPRSQAPRLMKVPDTTPEMKERVSYFTNPNAGNIHKRYVAIQDKDADESTCLLSSKFAPKPSRTPELPMSCQKKPQITTPFQKRNITPPLPFSSSKKCPRSTTPPLPFSSSKKNQRPTTPPLITTNPEKVGGRTPTPPKNKLNKTRTCLENRIKVMQTASQTLRQAKPETRPAVPDRTPELPRKLETRAKTLPISGMNIHINTSMSLKCPKTVLETPSLNGDQMGTPSGGSINDMRSKTLQNSVLKENVNSLRKKRLLVTMAATPKTPGLRKIKATPKPKTPMTRSSTMPTNAENTTLPLRPSKMLRNKTAVL